MRILSGIQPTGKLHIGNYFGAMRQHLQLQEQHEGFYFIADFHALTSSPSPAEIAQHSLDVAIDYLALGLDADMDDVLKILEKLDLNRRRDEMRSAAP